MTAETIGGDEWFKEDVWRKIGSQSSTAEEGCNLGWGEVARKISQKEAAFGLDSQRKGTPKPGIEVA